MNPAVAGDGAGLSADAERERFPWFLFVCVVLSFAAHAGTFLIFQVVYPQRATVPPPPPQVQLLAATLPQYAAIMSWVDAEDPALVSSAPSVRPAHLLDVPYRPSFSVQRTAPRGVPEIVEAVPFPAARPPLAIIRSADEQPAAPAPAPPPLPTHVTFSPSLASRTLVREPDFASAGRTTTTVEPSRYLVGVTERGEVRFVFLQKSSGSPELDAGAARSLAGASFAPAEAAVTWGHATVAWGDDVFAENPQQP